MEGGGGNDKDAFFEMKRWKYDRWAGTNGFLLRFFLFVSQTVKTATYHSTTSGCTLSAPRADDVELEQEPRIPVKPLYVVHTPQFYSMMSSAALSDNFNHFRFDGASIYSITFFSECPQSFFFDFYPSISNLAFFAKNRP